MGLEECFQVPTEEAEAEVTVPDVSEPMPRAEAFRELG